MNISNKPLRVMRGSTQKCHFRRTWCHFRFMLFTFIALF